MQLFVNTYCTGKHYGNKQTQYCCLWTGEIIQTADGTPLQRKRMATGYQFCALLLLITMEISKQRVVGPLLPIMVYYCGRKSRRV